MKISEGTYSLLVKLLTKFNEKSSVYGYAMVFGGQFLATKYQGDVAKGVEIVSALAGIVLWVVSDSEIHSLLTGKKPDSQPPTVPPNQG
ncbi:hypothetical protein [Dyella caseinilytica]|uniref:Uncharacterized protein n=1 Tax=Dyella caseinilytica TaxID=1849581 RepID=A0ABX7GXN2_9GAMM|nr:hypothetical protein [Dyella caseinilytica]QRN55241.1 hypothetical protein ISN74_07900 [Dyella caseinilytica]GGA00351.1 hypothetical protein GCM10011408_21580 [Dyella caseinilytica]